jgi:hypothetical protein
MDIAPPSSTPFTGPNRARRPTPRSRPELRPAKPPDVLQRGNVDETHNRREHDCRQHRLRPVPQQPRCEERHDST